VKFFLFLFLLLGGIGRAQQPLDFFHNYTSLASASSARSLLPSPPTNYFNDTAGVVSPQVAATLNQELANFDLKTSNQIVVAIYPQSWSQSPIEDIAQQLYTAWHPGTKKNSNGVLVLVFKKEHQVRIQTGYGLEGALPDVLCKRIIEEKMIPAFQHGDYAGGFTAGLNAIMKATAQEYHAAPPKKKSISWLKILFSPFGFFLFMMLFSILLNKWRSKNALENRTGGGFWWLGGGGWGDGGGSFGGGDGGGGFFGGGGDSGGGGAGGSW
jgi:uncharacterized protein